LSEEFSIDSIKNEIDEIFYTLKRKFDAAAGEGKPIIIFGVGSVGIGALKLIRKLSSAKIIFCDNDSKKHGLTIDSVPVISFDELKKNYSDSYVIIASVSYYYEILTLLTENNLHKNVIEIYDNVYIYSIYHNYYDLICENKPLFSKVYNFLSDDYSKQTFIERLKYCLTGNSKYLIPLRSKMPIYFDPEIISFSKDEIFIDGGAYTGDTVREFLKWTKGNYKKIYSFEPDINNRMEFSRMFPSNKDIELMPFGLWDKKGVLRFKSGSDSGSRINEDGNAEIPVISIDEFLDGNPVTFIKMDIEGAEMKAIKGAEASIKKYKPKLAICIYHEPLDIVEIPLFLKEIVPEYKIFIRHYSNGPFDTVCYAIP